MNRLRAIRTRVPLPAVILGGLLTLGVLVALYRYVRGLGAISNLSDSFPWGLWISFDLLCGVALGAGAFTTVAVLMIAGIVMNRFDVSLLALAHTQGVTYAPHWMEIAITAGIVSGGVIAYWIVARFFPLFTSGAHGRGAAGKQA